MNLRPTKIKVIFSIIIPVIFWIILANIRVINPPTELIENFFNLHYFEHLFSIGNITFFLIEVIVVYLIFSLFHRRHQYWNQPIKPL